MKNPNSPINKLKRTLKIRWSAPDHPEGEARFQVLLFAKDLAIFVLLPSMAVFIVKSCDGVSTGGAKSSKSKPKKAEYSPDHTLRSQIIDFSPKKTTTQAKMLGIPKRAPGTLVQVKLLNNVETYSNAPVHAVIVDNNLGSRLRGATLIGEATPDATFERINITFNLVKHPRRDDIALPITARALSLSGSLGVVAKKKEGYFARAALGSAQNVFGAGNKQNSDNQSLKDVLLQAFASGLLNEAGSVSNVERNRANVLTLDSSSIFYAELTDYFPEEL